MFHRMSAVVKRRSHFSEQNWILQPGELHYCFASLHALGKTIEGSGFDVDIEAGIYSPTSLQQIYTNPSRASTKAMAHRITISLMLLNLKFEAALDASQGDISHLREKCDEFRGAFHGRSKTINEQYENVRQEFRNQITPTLKTLSGELASYLDKYLLQVEALLAIVASCRSGDFEGYIVAAENAIKYLFAFDLHHYSRLMPVHIQEMKMIRRTDPDLWTDLATGFSVKKSGIPFCNLFSDQNLEQHIKRLKDSGCLLGLTQSPQSLQKLMFTSPHLGKIVEQFQSRNKAPRKEHYQLSGNAATRLDINVKMMIKLVKFYCSGNPFNNDFPLQNIVSSAEIPNDAKKEILSFDSEGTGLYEKFSDERLTVNSKISIWDPMKLRQIKTMNTWMKKIAARVGDEVVKLREERQLVARFLVIQQSRDLDLHEAIGLYEMSVIPRSLFCNAGNLLLPNVKSALISLIEGYVTPVPNQNEHIDDNENTESQKEVEHIESEVAVDDPPEADNGKAENMESQQSEVAVDDPPEVDTDNTENMESEKELERTESVVSKDDFTNASNEAQPLPEVERMIVIAQDVNWMDDIEL